MRSKGRGWVPADAWGAIAQPLSGRARVPHAHACIYIIKHPAGPAHAGANTRRRPPARRNAIPLVSCDVYRLPPCPRGQIARSSLGRCCRAAKPCPPSPAVRGLQTHPPPTATSAVAWTPCPTYAHCRGWCGHLTRASATVTPQPDEISRKEGIPRRTAVTARPWRPPSAWLSID